MYLWSAGQSFVRNCCLSALLPPCHRQQWRQYRSWGCPAEGPSHLICHVVRTSQHVRMSTVCSDIDLTGNIISAARICPSSYWPGVRGIRVGTILICGRNWRALMVLPFVACLCCRDGVSIWDPHTTEGHDAPIRQLLASESQHEGLY